MRRERKLVDAMEGIMNGMRQRERRIKQMVDSIRADEETKEVQKTGYRKELPDKDLLLFYYAFYNRILSERKTLILNK